MFEALIRDLRFAARGLARTPAFSIAAIPTLAIRLQVARYIRVIAGVMRQAIVTVLVGIAIGLGGAFWSARFLESLLFGNQRHDPGTLAAVAAIFLAVALVAASVPARRATLVDPVAALRAE